MMLSSMHISQISTTRRAAKSDIHNQTGCSNTTVEKFPFGTQPEKIRWEQWVEEMTYRLENEIIAGLNP